MTWSTATYIIFSVLLKKWETRIRQQIYPPFILDLEKGKLTKKAVVSAKKEDKLIVNIQGKSTNPSVNYSS